MKIIPRASSSSISRPNIETGLPSFVARRGSRGPNSWPTPYRYCSKGPVPAGRASDRKVQVRGSRPWRRRSSSPSDDKKVEAPQSAGGIPGGRTISRNIFEHGDSPEPLALNRGSHATFLDTTRMFAVVPSPCRSMRCPETWAKRRLVHSFDRIAFALPKRTPSSVFGDDESTWRNVRGEWRYRNDGRTAGGCAHRNGHATSRRNGHHARCPTSGATRRNRCDRSGSGVLDRSAKEPELAQGRRARLHCGSQKTGRIISHRS